MKNKHQGFTLIEVMVVVVIAAIMMGAVTLSFPDSSNDRLKEHGMRFSALISLAQDEAILQSEDFALSINNSGYSFFRRSGEAWELYSDKPFGNRKMTVDVKSAVILEGLPIKLKTSEKSKPQIVVYSSGEMTPFTYVLTNQQQSTITLKFDGAGNLERTYKPNEK